MSPSLGLGPLPEDAPRLRPIHTIAREIAASPWQRKGGTSAQWAKPYLQAMLSLSHIEESYHADSARTVLLYFLSNASGFKGPEAKRLKNELRVHLGEKARG